MCREGAPCLRYLDGDWVLLLLLFFSERDVAALRWSVQGSMTKMPIPPRLFHLLAEYCAYSYLSPSCRLSKVRLGRGGEAKLAWRVNVRIEMR